MAETHIYGLICPIENKVMYIGKSVQIRTRLQQHEWETKIGIGRNTLKGKWLKDLQSKNLSPSVIILDTCEDNEWRERERYWITYYRELNPELKNMGKGGEGRY